MRLDPITLGLAFLLLSGVLGLLLLFSWILNRNVQALAWWGAAYCLVPFGMGMITLSLAPPSLVILLGSNAVMALVNGIVYAGCRVFNERPRPLVASLLGVTVWIILFPIIKDSFPARLLVACLIAGSYTFLSAWELWRHARYRLVSQRLAIILLLLLTAFYVLRSTLGFVSTGVGLVDALALRWSSNLGLLLLLFIPALAFVFLSMAKEKVEYEHKQAALVDPLTGIPNRRAFLRNASELLRRQGGGRPAACLLFDLDNFKQINDSHGHDIGDHILTVFGKVLAAHLPEGSFGRMGGEEFAAVVPLARRQVEELAEEIRQSFAADAKMALGQQVAATVSIGCAAAADATVHQLIQDADRALYRAKAAGRDAVVVADARSCPA
ncbi:GGDEF domain-containing protein [Microvirga puerhi]|uniref:diguanylate cyclase n=1 Tax=Microvirga puerhi TaxID=2876078 RepID=A0ABS7VLS1_9HYPH|nr:GGDEF domain-containing protein [Microvirga puerhi]MBZ6076179.1 GGDEF domain-containing protein [Microvirga puerhi]